MLVFNSTFFPFSSSVEGKFEHFKILHQFRLTPELYEMVHDLTKNETLVEELSQLFGRSITQLEAVDDFEELTNGLAPKICIGFCLVTEFLISNVLGAFFILFDKYGEDPMKRSLYNQINGQVPYPAILSSLICTPAWTWRIYLGPLNTFMADVTIFIHNSCIIWILFCLLEAIVVRTLQLVKFKHVGGINDDFFARLVFRFNAAFAFGAHIGLFYLGSLGSDELLTGVLSYPRGLSHFYKITVGTLSIISVVSWVTCGIKRLEAYWKERKIANNINVLINNVPGQPVQNLNNNKYNEPIINIFVLVAFKILFITTLISFFIILGVNHSILDYINSFWIWCASSIFFRTIIPIFITTFYHKKFRNFISRSVKYGL